MEVLGQEVIDSLFPPLFSDFSLLTHFFNPHNRLRKLHLLGALYITLQVANQCTKFTFDFELIFLAQLLEQAHERAVIILLLISFLSALLFNFLRHIHAPA